MIKDVLTKSYEIEIDGSCYTLEYDNLAYAKIEQLTGKGLFALYNDFVVKNDIKYEDFVEIVCCGLLKNHYAQEIVEVRKFLNENIAVGFLYAASVTLAFAEPLMPPEVVQKAQQKSLKKKKKMTKK